MEQAMSLKVALQMDPIGSVNINADSTFRIALEAQARGHQLFSTRRTGLPLSKAG
jgi:glutathione synthase/RimK-type ligase-like ATP-grasp enzyme